MLRSKPKRAVLINLAIALALFSAWGVQYAFGQRSQQNAVKPEASVTTEVARDWIKTGENLTQIPKATWEELLDDHAYDILWKKGTERAFTGELLAENRDGVFVTAGCRLPVFKSDHKYKSGSGWPSFWEVFNKDNIILKEDRSWGMRRVEVLSACGEHLGHVFNDGPEPTGLRYCINSAALAFVPSGKSDTLGPFFEKAAAAGK